MEDRSIDRDGGVGVKRRRRCPDDDCDRAPLADGCADRCAYCLEDVVYEDQETVSCPRCHAGFHMGCAFKHWIMARPSASDVPMALGTESDIEVASVCPLCRDRWDALTRASQWLDLCMANADARSAIASTISDVLSDYETVFEEVSAKMAFSDAEMEDVKASISNYQRLNQLLYMCTTPAYCYLFLRGMVPVGKFIAVNGMQLQAMRKLALLSTSPSNRLLVLNFYVPSAGAGVAADGADAGESTDSDAGQGTDF